ncbi:Pycsar system effector family protein [Streptomyces buecherae]|uniref:Integral membrane plasmid transfer protein n=1 Tax=Streptomyces buecherae TaxID=2763006 RepID=A0A7H8NB48_9ACTN|nr:Pycsar system effector family protein [Streptomyces buecherae]QKW50958.1 integral membrane plasmid transfer protein [Streptomyces buecherae]
MSAPTTRLDGALAAAHAEVKAEIARTDSKASLLLAFIGAALAAVGTVALAVGSAVVPAALVAGAPALVMLVAAAGVLLGVVRPRLAGAPAGFPKWATLTPDGVRAALAVDGRAADIAALSRITLAKYSAIQRAIDLIRASAAPLAIAAVVAAGGAVL